MTTEMTGEDLRRRRLAMGLTLEQLGDLLGKPFNTIARWERGEVTIRDATMLDLALQTLERTQAKRPDTPESVERKAKAARGVIDTALEVLEGRQDDREMSDSSPPDEPWSIERKLQLIEAIGVDRPHGPLRGPTA